MKMRDQCLPCLINQIVKVALMTQVDHREKLYQKIFTYLSQIDLSRSNPEVIGDTFRLLKEYVHSDDPYCSIRQTYNTLMEQQIPAIREK